MKKSIISILMGINLFFLSISSFAGTIEPKQKVSNENPWSVFKETIYLFNHSKVDFYFADETTIHEFLSASIEIKEKLASFDDEKSVLKIKKINSVVSMFTFIWDTKNDLETEETEIFLIDFPKISS